jgi:type II secretory pathway predicted ATPase ExeA
VKHPAPVHERDRIQHPAIQRMRDSHHANPARQYLTKMLQSVAYLVGTGKTVAIRAAVADPDPASHTVIYIGNPATGVRGILAHVVTALGGKPVHGTAALAVQARSVLAGEAAERGRTPVPVIDEAHMLDHDQLESIRMLTLCRDRDYAGDLHELPDPASGSRPACPGIIPVGIPE